jgi:hypothetical protein
LNGEWAGEGSGAPGQGAGGFSFAPDLQGKILVRKNHAEYPATKERAAFTHDDLMIVYPGAAGEHPHAIYFDNEGHVIRYEVRATADGSQVVFESTAEPAAMRYRLTYVKPDADHVKIKFELAPATAPEKFSTYIEAAAHRASR